VINLTPDEAAAKLDVTKQTLAQWRYRGYGPRFIKYGVKILYPADEIDAFLLSCLRKSTKEKVNG
jgi:predicted site-specific integrase-resolvase